ncbi:unnamed protein product [Pipistrellus nathusii]|uniref:Large ribosomal subunit protein uL15/eL18 domain-containing protein n=1 Tax=Pipistrellus nathusii TaxID=59473 RepID=A0ABN9Z186_PIPNA
MGVDIRHNEDRKVRRKESKSQDIDLRLLVKLYRFPARRTAPLSTKWCSRGCSCVAPTGQAVAFPDDPQDEASWPGGQDRRGCRDDP